MRTQFSNTAGQEIATDPNEIILGDSLSASYDGEKMTIEVDDAGISTEKLADGAVTYDKRKSVAAVTASDDGLTTGIIPAAATFVTVTSAGATKAVSLPAATADTVGRSIDIYVGANGYELLTEAASNDKINTVDSDGTNQLDVAATTLLRVIQVSATEWVAYQIAATTITVVAPDND